MSGRRRARWLESQGSHNVRSAIGVACQSAAPGMARKESEPHALITWKMDAVSVLTQTLSSRFHASYKVFNMLGAGRQDLNLCFIP